MLRNFRFTLRGDRTIANNKNSPRNLPFSSYINLIIKPFFFPSRPLFLRTPTTSASVWSTNKFHLRNLFFLPILWLVLETNKNVYRGYAWREVYKHFRNARRRDGHNVFYGRFTSAFPSTPASAIRVKSRIHNKIFICFRSCCECFFLCLSCFGELFMNKNNIFLMQSLEISWTVNKQISQFSSTLEHRPEVRKKTKTRAMFVGDSERSESETAEFNYKHSINLLNALLRFGHHSHRWHFIFKTTKRASRKNTTNMLSAFHHLLSTAHGTMNIRFVFAAVVVHEMEKKRRNKNAKKHLHIPGWLRLSCRLITPSAKWRKQENKWIFQKFIKHRLRSVHEAISAKICNIVKNSDRHH